jgi:hypothetical protein
MKKIKLLHLLLSVNLLSINCSAAADEEQPPHSTENQKPAIEAKEPGAVIFTPPEGWMIADAKALPPSVKIMVVGQGEHEFPPSINLGVEDFNGTLKEYLKTIKAINDSQGAEWKDLGTIRTEAGNASLSQVDSKTEWGDVRMMHVVLVKNKKAFILTAAALKEEFPRFYKDFFRSMRSLRINKDIYEMVPTASRRAQLEKADVTLKDGWNSLIDKEKSAETSSETPPIAHKVFESAEFQEKYWAPFKSMLESDFRDLGKDWQEYLLTKIQNDLIN